MSKISLNAIMMISFWMIKLSNFCASFTSLCNFVQESRLEIDVIMKNISSKSFNLANLKNFTS